MKEIELSQGYKALVDDKDYETVNALTWHVHRYKSGTCYAEHTRSVEGKTITYRMHQFITGQKGIDHRDGDGLNDQRSNFRLATPHQNRMNKKKYRSFVSIYKGVGCKYLAGGDKRFSAYIGIDGKQKHLGYFDVEIDAAEAYDKAAVHHFGTFARLNFPQDYAK